MIHSKYHCTTAHISSSLHTLTLFFTTEVPTLNSLTRFPTDQQLAWASSLYSSGASPTESTASSNTSIVGRWLVPIAPQKRLYASHSYRDSSSIAERGHYPSNGCFSVSTVLALSKHATVLILWIFVGKNVDYLQPESTACGVFKSNNTFGTRMISFDNLVTRNWRRLYRRLAINPRAIIMCTNNLIGPFQCRRL
jgi:hypothetical protein